MRTPPARRPARAERGRLDRTVARAARPTAAEPQVERALLFGEDADGDVETRDQVAGARPRGAPAHASRGRSEAGRTVTSGSGALATAGVRSASHRPGRTSARRRTRSPARRWLRDSGWPARGDRSSTSSRSGPSAGFSLATRMRSNSSRRTGGGSGVGVGPGNSLAKPIEHTATLAAETRLERGDRVGHDPRSAIGLIAGDEQVPDLVEETERRDLPGADRRRTGFARRVHARRPAGGCRPGRW